MDTIKFVRERIPEYVTYDGKISFDIIEEAIINTQEKFKVIGGLAVCTGSNVYTVSEYETIRPEAILGKCINITEDYIEIKPRTDKYELAKLLSDNGYKARLRAVVYKKGDDLIFPRIIGFDIIEPKNGGDKDVK